MQPLPNNPQTQTNEFTMLPQQEQEQLTPLQNLKQSKTKWQSSVFFQYFVSKTKDKQKLIEIEQKYNKNLYKKIQKQIQEGQTTITKKKKRISSPTEIKQSEEEKYQREKRELNQKKKIYQQNLSRILETEKKLLQKNIGFLKKSRQRSMSHFQIMNPSWKQDVSLSLKKIKRFQKTLKEKDRSIEIQIEKLRLQDIENKAKIIEAIKFRNKNQIIEKHSKYQSLKEKERNERIKCQNLIAKIKPEFYNFEKLKQIRRRQLQRDQSQRKLKQERLRKQRITLSHKELEAHEQAFMQMINQRKQRWITQFESFRASNKIKVRQYQGVFMQNIIQQRNRIKEQKDHREQLKMQAIRKAKEYSEYVKDSFKPIISKGYTIKKQQKKHNSLNRMQQRIRGLQNLKFVKEENQQKRKNDLKEERKIVKTTSFPRLQSKTIYKNYLKEQSSNIRTQKSMKLELKTLLSERKQDWAQSACKYIEKLQSEQSTKKGKPLIETAFRKLELLNALY